MVFTCILTDLKRINKEAESTVASLQKTMRNKELMNLSNDIREFLIRSVSKTGGHLSSNLGVVELTVALHKVFDSPKDKSGTPLRISTIPSFSTPLIPSVPTSSA